MTDEEKVANYKSVRVRHDEIVRLRALVLLLKRGSCWCEAGIGTHTEACRQAQRLEL